MSQSEGCEPGELNPVTPVFTVVKAAAIAVEEHYKDHLHNIDDIYLLLTVRSDIEDFNRYAIEKHRFETTRNTVGRPRLQMTTKIQVTRIIFQSKSN